MASLHTIVVQRGRKTHSGKKEVKGNTIELILILLVVTVGLLMTNKPTENKPYLYKVVEINSLYRKTHYLDYQPLIKDSCVVLKNKTICSKDTIIVKHN